MPWSEVASIGVDADRNGVARAQRTFRVWNVSPMTIRTSPQSVLGGGTNGYGSDQLPAYGSGLPEDPGLRLDRYSVNSTDNVTFDVVALYSNDGRFRFPARQPDPTIPTELEELSGDKEVIRREIPFARQTLTVVANEISGTSANLYGWTKDEHFIVPESRWVIRATVRAEGQVGSLLARVQNEDGKLHKINGVWYLFEAGRWRATGTVVEFDYAFIRDRGTRATLPISPPANMFFPPQNVPFAAISGAELYIRPPYCEISLISMVTGPVPPDTVPVLMVFPVCPFEFSGPSNNGTGWHQLPGINSLWEP